MSRLIQIAVMPTGRLAGCVTPDTADVFPMNAAAQRPGPCRRRLSEREPDEDPLLTRRHGLRRRVVSFCRHTRRPHSVCGEVAEDADVRGTADMRSLLASTRWRPHIGSSRSVVGSVSGLTIDCA